MKKLLVIIILLATAFAGCKKDSNSNAEESVEFSGTISKTEASYYQYGTHTIKNNNEVYALTSERVNLNNYNNKTVTVVGSKVSGYPIEGGPVLLKVSKVK